MDKKFIQLTSENLNSEHICCAFSDKKCTDGYALKKQWLKQAFEHGYIFRRLDERAKVFIEYGPAEYAWLPIDATGYLNINCFWVSGQYKKQGYAKALLTQALNDAKAQNKHGLVTVVGTKKLHFMSDTQWLLKQGFKECEKTDYGFSLLVKQLTSDAPVPKIKDCALNGICAEKKGLVAYYSNRCPFTEFHVNTNLIESAQKRGLPLKIIKLDMLEKAQTAPTPATIFSLFYKGQFITQDLSACMDNRFDKVTGIKI